MLSYDMTGSGPLLLLLHPVGLDRTFWGELPKTLSPMRTVVAVDTAGHGTSPDAVRPGRMNDRVADIIDLLNRLDRGPATLLGISFGGMIAQQVALARPDLVSGLILGGCPGEIPASAREAILKRGAEAEQGGMEAVLASTMERWFSAPFLSTDAAERVRRRLLANVPANWAAAWEAVSDHAALDRLPTLDIPTLVIAGAVDAATSLDAKRRLATAVPGSRLVVLADAPHIMQVECPALFAQAVLGFIEAQERA